MIRKALALIAVVFVIGLAFIPSGAAAKKPEFRRHLEIVGWTNYGDPPGLNSEIVVLGDYVVTGTLFGSTLVRISDVSDPANPMLVGEVGLGFTEPFDVKTNGDYDRCPLDGSNSFGGGTADAVCSLVLASGHGSPVGAHLIDITTPSAPTLLSSIDLSDKWGGGSHNSFLWGDYAFVSGIGGGWLIVYDVSTPTAPVRVAEFQTEIPIFIHDLFVQENDDRVLAYIASIGEGLIILDVTVCTSGGCGVGGTVTDLSDRIVAENRYNEGLLIGEQDFVAHYVEPTEDGAFTFLGDETECGRPGGIRVFDTSSIPEVGERAVVPQVNFIELPASKAVQCANLPALMRTGHGPILKNAYAFTGHNFDIVGDKMYHGDYFRGVNVFDISDPANPVLIANARLHLGVGVDQRNDPGQEILVQYPLVWQAVSDGSYIYASDIVQGLFVLKLVDLP